VLGHPDGDRDLEGRTGLDLDARGARWVGVDAVEVVASGDAAGGPPVDLGFLVGADLLEGLESRSLSTNATMASP